MSKKQPDKLSGMRISEFVSESLTEILIGVHSAKLNAAEIGGIVPGSTNAGAQQGDPKLIEEYVEFEIAVTVVDNNRKEVSGHGSGGAKITVFSATAEIGAGAEGKSSADNKNEQLSRLKFRVPVQMNANFRSSLRDDPDLWQQDRDALETVKKRMAK